MSCPILVRSKTSGWSLILCIQNSVFKQCDWSEFYRDAKEIIPMNAPEPQGKEVDICMLMDSGHAGDKGIIDLGVVFLNT